MEPSPEHSPPTTTATAADAFAAGGGHEPCPPSSSTSLFPLFPLSAPTEVSQCLPNPSFSFDASSLNIPPTTSSSLPLPLSPSSDEEAAPKPAPAKYDLLPSSPSDDERGSRRGDRKRRKRRRDRERYDGAASSRKPGVHAWAGSETKLVKDYYVDAKGDQDNLSFGSIYRDPSIVALLFALSFEWSKAGSYNRIHSLFERALADDKLQMSVLLWRCYLAYEAEIACNTSAARRVSSELYMLAHGTSVTLNMDIRSKRLWLDGFQKLSSVLTMKELSDLQEVMHGKELFIRIDIYEILLQDEDDT